MERMDKMDRAVTPYPGDGGSWIWRSGWMGAFMASSAFMALSALIIFGANKSKEMGSAAFNRDKGTIRAEAAAVAASLKEPNDWVGTRTDRGTLITAGFSTRSEASGGLTSQALTWAGPAEILVGRFGGVAREGDLPPSTFICLPEGVPGGHCMRWEPKKAAP